VERLSGLLKDNAGYDLPSLLVGSEGTLVIVTRVAVRLVPAHRARVAALFGLGGLDDALALLMRLRERRARRRHRQRAHLHLTRSPAEIAAMRAIKPALDPAGILNPGCVLPARR
jgi:FAD/FMN-containing dehydrogenase